MIQRIMYCCSVALALLALTANHVAAQSAGAEIAQRYPTSLILVRRGDGTTPVDRLLAPSVTQQDQQTIRQHFDLSGVSLGRIDLLNIATLADDLLLPNVALIAQGSDIANPLLAEVFLPGMRFYAFATSFGLTPVALSRPDGTQLTTNGAPRVIARENRNLIVTAADPALGIHTVLYPPGTQPELITALLEQAGLDPQTIVQLDNINLTQLAQPGTALLNGEAMFLDPAADFVLNFAPNMGIYFIEAQVSLQDVTPAGLSVTDTLPGPVAEPEAPERDHTLPTRITPATPIASEPGLAAQASDPAAPQSAMAAADPDPPVLATDEAFLDGYMYASGGPQSESFIRPGFCDTGVADIIVVQYQLEANPDWGTYVGTARSTLNSTTYWRDDFCAGDRGLDVTMRLIFDGVEHGRFTARIEDASRISDAVFEVIAPPPANTAFSRAIARTRFEDLRIILPQDWVPGTPPGINSQSDARFAHALYVEAMAAKPDLFTWSDESLELFQMASALGHRGATDELLNQADFRNVVPRVFYNLSQGNPPIDNEITAVIASHGALYETAIAQQIGYYAYLDQAMADYDVDIADGVIALNENAPPNHYDITDALNATTRQRLNPVSEAYVTAMGLPAEAGWVCDGTWCVATGGMARMRLLARFGTVACTLDGVDRARCQFGLVPLFRPHQALEGTAQQQLFDWMMEPQRADTIAATADLVRSGDGWEIVGLLELR